MVGAKLLGEFGLVDTPTDRRYLETHVVGILDGEMTKAADADVVSSSCPGATACTARWAVVSFVIRILSCFRSRPGSWPKPAVR